MVDSRPTSDRLALSEVLAALSYALDLTEGQVPGHTARSAFIGMRIGEELRLSDEDRSRLFYALLLKDAGCSSNAAKVCSLFGADDFTLKRELKVTDWPRYFASARYALRNTAPEAPLLERAGKLVRLGLKGPDEARQLTQIRCERGADIARMIGFPEETALAIRGLDEHWDGNGHPDGVAGADIPLMARIACLAQTVDVFVNASGRGEALRVARRRSGTWFDPELVRVLESLADDEAFWGELESDELRETLAAHEPPDTVVIADDVWLDRVAEAFARIIDAKSPWTSQHSDRVADIALGIADAFGLDGAELRELRRAALLHDIGKLGVSNLILDKAGPLTDEEFAAMRQHTWHTFTILSLVAPFRVFAPSAAAHHEKLDGSGYHRGLAGEQIDRMARILAVADIFEALSSERPYRKPMQTDEALDCMRREAGDKLCAETFAALAQRTKG